MTELVTELPHDLRTYILREHASVCRGNNANNKCTTQAELDEATIYCKRLYALGLKLTKKISAEDLERCKKLYILRKRNAFSIYDLVRTTIGKRWVLVPSYVGLIDEMRALREAIM